jgi:hypothetical protein
MTANLGPRKRESVLEHRSNIIARSKNKQVTFHHGESLNGLGISRGLILQHQLTSMIIGCSSTASSVSSKGPHASEVFRLKRSKELLPEITRLRYTPSLYMEWDPG